MGDKHNWYKEWFGRDYLRVYPHRDQYEAKLQVDFTVKILSIKNNDRILDLGCGNGRHAVELSRRGYHVTGLDLSPILLSMAKHNNGVASCQTYFVRADMRRLPFNAAFDCVASFFTTFGYFETDEENVKTLDSFFQVLKPGGRFLQDYMNKTQVINNLVPHDARVENDFEIIQERRYNREQERIEKKVTLLDGNGKREYFESVRLYTLNEMKALLWRANLALDHTFGDFDGRPFDKNSPRLILTGHKENVSHQPELSL